MKVTVNKAALAAARKKLQTLAKRKWLGPLANAICAGGMKLVADEFKAERDPYGAAWKPLKRERTRDRLARRKLEKKGKTAAGGKILQDTGRMRSSVGIAVVRSAGGGASAKITIPVWYAAVHQNGAVIPPHTRLGRPGESFFRRNPNGRRGYQIVKSYRATFVDGIKIPQRRMLPEASDLPPLWHDMVKRESERFLESLETST